MGRARKKKLDQWEACLDVNKDEGRNDNCLLERLLFSCTGPTACFFFLFFFYSLTKRPSVFSCVRLCVYASYGR